MEIISSLENNKVKSVVRLFDKKYRETDKCFVAEGSRWVFDAIEKNADIIMLAVSEFAYAAFQERLTEMRDKVFVFKDSVFNKMTQVENSQGILAIIKIPNPSQNRPSDYCLFLDRLRDPGNLGTIFRTACAAGYKDIILNNCVDAFNPKTVRASMSAILDLNIKNGDIDEIRRLKEYGHTVVAADINGKDVFSLTDKPERLALVIGSEAEGIGLEVLKLCDMRIKIPMNNIESLNAAVSAGILMYTLKK